MQRTVTTKSVWQVDRMARKGYMCRSNLRSSLSGRRSKSCGQCTDTDGAETVQRTKPNRRNKETPPCRSPTRSKYTMTGHEAKQAALPCGRTGIYRGRPSLLHCRRHPKSLECSNASLTGGARRICVVVTAEGVQSVGQWVIVGLSCVHHRERNCHRSERFTAPVGSTAKGEELLSKKGYP